MKRLFLIVVLSLVLWPCGSADAALYDRGGGLIYDSTLDITWYDYTYYYAGITWGTAKSWAETLTVIVNGDEIGGWRLPRNLPVNGSAYDYTRSFDGSTDEGYGITSPNSEMAHLFYVDLGNVGYHDNDHQDHVNPAWTGSLNTGPFTNLWASWYWSEIEYPPDPHYGRSAWAFSFYYGLQVGVTASGSFPGLAVHAGDVAPEPASLSLLALGALALIRRRTWRR